MNSISSASSISDKNIEFASYLTNSFGNSNGNECGDVTCGDLLVARLLSQLSKENNSAEMKEREEKRTEDEKRETEERLRAQEEKFVENAHRMYDNKFLDGKVKMIGEILSQLRPDDKEEISRTFLSMSTSPECCSAMRQSKCLPVVIGLLHTSWHNDTVRTQATKTLNNIVSHCADTKQGRKEAFVFKLVEQMLRYCEVRESTANGGTPAFMEPTTSPINTVALLMKLSFNEEYRVAMCEFGALYALAKVVETEHLAFDGAVDDLPSETLMIRRFASMALTNLTFRDCANKATLCSFDTFMRVLVAQLRSSYEDLCQVTASVLRNLSWRADSYIKATLRNVEAVTALMKAALRLQKETTLKAVLSALWNLSAHNNQNKIDICNVEGSIEYLVKMLNYQAPSGSLTIVENVGGVLRNVSSLIAVREDYRMIIREYNCLYVLLHQLTSPSLTVVSNACGTLWNLSARCPEDQIALINLGALNMLRSLIHSKHKMISVACSAALKNLQNVRDAEVGGADGTARLTTSTLRKRRALQDEIDTRIRETGGGGDRPSVDSSPREAETPCTTPEAKGGEQTRSTTTNSVRFSLPSGGEGRKTTSPSKGASGATKGILAKATGGGDDDAKSTNGYRKVEEPYNVDDTFNDYAETDLDQPTNYSLRFAEMGRIDAEQGELMVTGEKEEADDDDEVNKMSEMLGQVCCTETPLMYSRSSSLGSVSVGSGAPADDDVGSVVSDFSHAVSGVISPSEIPASPSETVPTSPRTASKCAGGGDGDRRSVFEDTVTVFKDEATPIQFSIASSLSSLTFDDADAQPPLEAVTERVEKREPADDDDDTDSSNNAKECCRVFMELELSPEEEQAMLNDCIDRGRPRDEKATAVAASLRQPVGDVTMHFCTEDTPVSISHAASNSDLSLLCPSEDSFLQNSMLPLSSCADDDTDIIGLPDDEQEKLLNMCIASGQSMNYGSHSAGGGDDCHSSQSSTLSGITEDLPVEEHTLIKDMTESANLMTTTFSTVTATAADEENDYSFEGEDDGDDDDEVDGKELSEEQSENLLNQCIALGMRNMKDTKDASDLENIGPPSFLAEANLDGSLINVEEITDYPAAQGKMTPKQRRNQIKNRFSTYTVKLSPTKSAAADGEDASKKVTPSKERRIADKDRFKTRTLSRNDFDEIGKNQEQQRVNAPPPPKSPKLSAASKNEFVDENRQRPVGVPPKSPKLSAVEDAVAATPNVSDGEGNAADGDKTKRTPRSTSKAKSSIPVVRSKLPTVKSAPAGKSNDSPVSLQRQNTFTKEDASSVIPVRKNLSKGAATAAVGKTAANETVTSLYRSGIPARIKEPSPKAVTPPSRKTNADARSADFSKNRWSVSENDLNASNAAALKASSVSLNVSSPNAAASRISPAASHSALPVRREPAATAVRSPMYGGTHKK